MVLHVIFVLSVCLIYDTAALYDLSNLSEAALGMIIITKAKIFFLDMKHVSWDSGVFP